MEKVISYRREFHKYPEVGWKEIRTTARIAEILSQLGYTELKIGMDAIDINSIIKQVRLTEEERMTEMERAVRQGANEGWVSKTNGYPGVVAEINTGIIGPTTAFRFDIDALGGLEPNDKGYRPFEKGFISINKNTVHACGHDGHTSIGLGLAKEIIDNKDRFKGTIRLLFQPAEETYCGAESMVSKGYLDDVDYLFAMHIGLSHNGKPLPSHSIAAGCSDFLSDNQYDVFYTGRAAHPSGASQEGKNAMLAACTAVLNIHSIAPHEEGLLRVNVGEIVSGISVNTIAPNALMKLEFRGENQNITEYAKERVLTIVKASAEMYDLEYEIVDYGEIVTAKSDVELVEIVKRAAHGISWFKDIYDEGNVGGSDDATVMMKKVQENGGKAVYFGLGADVNEPLHNTKFDFDESVLPASVKLCMKILETTNQ